MASSSRIRTDGTDSSTNADDDDSSTHDLPHHNASRGSTAPGAARPARDSSSIEGATYITTPGPQDVLFGRGKPYQGHSGNLRLHEMTDEYRDQFLAERHEGRRQIVANMIQKIKDEGGRFLKRRDSSDGNGGAIPSTAASVLSASSSFSPDVAVTSLSQEDGWVEVPDRLAKGKVSHILRGKPRKGKAGAAIHHHQQQQQQQQQEQQPPSLQHEQLQQQQATPDFSVFPNRLAGGLSGAFSPGMLSASQNQGSASRISTDVNSANIGLGQAMLQSSRMGNPSASHMSTIRDVLLGTSSTAAANPTLIATLMGLPTANAASPWPATILQSLAQNPNMGSDAGRGASPNAKRDNEATNAISTLNRRPQCTGADASTNMSLSTGSGSVATAARAGAEGGGDVAAGMDGHATAMSHGAPKMNISLSALQALASNKTPTKGDDFQQRSQRPAQAVAPLRTTEQNILEQLSTLNGGLALQRFAQPSQLQSFPPSLLAANAATLPNAAASASTGTGASFLPASLSSLASLLPLTGAPSSALSSAAAATARAAGVPAGMPSVSSNNLANFSRSSLQGNHPRTPSLDAAFASLVQQEQLRQQMQATSASVPPSASATTAARANASSRPQATTSPSHGATHPSFQHAQAGPNGLSADLLLARYTEKLMQQHPQVRGMYSNTLARHRATQAHIDELLQRHIAMGLSGQVGHPMASSTTAATMAGASPPPAASSVSSSNVEKDTKTNTE